jgi:predicted phosphodiesterase
MVWQDRRVSVERPSPENIVDVTTVTDTSATVHVSQTGDRFDVAVHVFDGLTPDSEHDVEVPTADGGVESVTVRTLPTPQGQLRCVFTTVNDLHFGEPVAGQIDDSELGPLRRSAPGEDPYPEVMNRVAVDEMAAIDPAAVVVKGDLSLDGAEEEFAAFEATYRTRFGERLFVTRGNHDAYRHQEDYAGDQRIDLDGIVLALLDTTIPGATTGNITAEQASWLDEVADGAADPVMVLGHHQQWIPDASAEPHEAKRSEDYFGLHPDASDRLDEVCARRPSILAYAAGHTHRHRVRRMAQAKIPSIEVGCTKDFPGTWAEYRVYDDAVMQIVHRMSSAEALTWSESCRNLYADFGIEYSGYALGNIEDRCFVMPTR